MTEPRRFRYLVSAIVSTYNADRFLAGKLEDLEAQTIASQLEIIVIDSASPGNERAIVEQFQRRFDNIRYLRTDQRETVYQAWNRGIRMATGEFVTNANTDDRLRHDAYEVLVQALRERPECVLAYPNMRITKQENATFERHEPFGFRDWPDFDRLNLLELCCVGPFPLWRKSLHDDIGYFDERFKSAADYELWLRAALKYDFVHVPQFLGLYWLSEETVSRKGDLPTLEYLEVQKEYRPRFAPITPAPVELEPEQWREFQALATRLDAGDGSILPELEGFSARHPRAPRFHLELARIFYKKGEIGYAKKYFEKAVIIDPGNDSYRDALHSFLKSELYQALQHQTAFIAGNPDDLEAHLCAGMILILMERYQAALPHYRRALELSPGNALAQCNIAFLERRLSPGEDAGYFTCERPEVRRLVSRRARRVLDVGCAAGRLGLALKKRQGAEVWGIEPAPEAARAAQAVLDRVLAGSVEEALPGLPQDYFDSIVAADVLEHLVDPERVLRELAAKLSPGGEVIVSLPNVRHWSVLKELLEGNWEYRDAGILDRTHLRFFTRNSALALFDRAGYAVTSVAPVALSGDEGVPELLLRALATGGIETPTLQEEGGVYQYLFRLVPKGRELTSIVILTFNELECTRECLESIDRHTPEPHEVILVDNGSTDGTIPYLREFCAQRNGYRLIENGTNLGFAAGCNVGMREAHGGHILLLNNDVVVTRGWLSGMLDALAREPEAGLVGPMTNRIAGPQQTGDAVYHDTAGMDAYAASFRSANYGRRIPVDKLVGFCLLFTRAVLAEVGELDTRFGSGNFEDDDFCLRAALKGYRCVIAGDVFIHHYGSRSFTGNRIDHAAAMRQNRRLFDVKWDLSSLELELAVRLVVHNAQVQGKKLAQRGEMKQAVDLLLEQGIALAGGAALPYLTLAGILAQAGKPRQALEVLAETPAKDDLVALLLRGRCHRELGEPEVALDLSEEAAKLDPEDPGVLHLQGVLALDAGDRQKGEEDLREALAGDPGCASAYGALASLFWERGDRDQALRLAELSFALDPLELSALGRYHDYATACEALPREEERLREALLLYPEHKGLCYGLIELLIRGARYGEAIAAIEEAAVRYGLDDAAIDAALQIRTLAGAPPAPRPGSGSISVCMIVKNEVQHLAQALLSVRGLADELVVVDTGSSDRTGDIARIFGARLFSFPWNGSFADARNFSLAQAAGDWIMILDADEALAAEDLPPLVETVRRGDTVAYSFVTRNYTGAIARRNWVANAGEYAELERGQGWTPSEKVRLFPNRPDLRFEGAVHELLEPSLVKSGIAIHAVDVPVHHYGRLDQARNREKQEHYYLLGRKKLAESAASPDALLELARQATELERLQEAQELWHLLLQGTPGHAEAHFNLGYLHLAAGDYGLGYQHALLATELDPELKEAAFNLAKCELYRGHVPAALARCQDMLHHWPGYPAAHSLFAVCLLLQGDRTGGEAEVAGLAAQGFDCGDFLNEYAGGLRRGGLEHLAAPLADLAARLQAGVRP
ncbi:glycosyltransferase [Geomonas propionica]|uniref:Glycosyltransferase n=1 Tax=Geomonas propionica TaxID=2798582 RepID=A0ABS0YTC6_9BACT|nr:glycosyltransferase [Geomonas propionica]MBJ6801184.1 glycosyltransferase [Geomonas propionica]